MNKVASLLIAIVLSSNIAHASILGNEDLKINFTDKNDAETKATWSEPDKINITRNGLGWDGEQASSREIWIQTVPLAVGISWRPAQSVDVTVEIKPDLKSIKLNDGTTYMPYPGDAFVRYSPDRKHWSFWQAMECPNTRDGKYPTKRKYASLVNIPHREREEYKSYMAEYQKLDVPWASDEEALCKWILTKDPDFFSKHIPFVGYLQFLYEISLPGGQRITELHATASYGLSGLSQVPKDKNAEEGRYIPWKFEVK